MGLGFSSAGADCRPTDEVGNILRNDRVEKLRAGRHPHGSDLQEELAGDLHASFDVVAAVEVRIVNQSLPADRRARLFKINPHHNIKPVCQLLPQTIEFGGVFQRGLRIMNGTRADHHQETLILLLQNSRDDLT